MFLLLVLISFAKNALESTLVGRVALVVQAMSSERYDERMAILHRLKQSNPSNQEVLSAC